MEKVLGPSQEANDSLLSMLRFWENSKSGGSAQRADPELAEGFNRRAPRHPRNEQSFPVPANRHGAR